MSETTAVWQGYAQINGLKMYYEIHGQGRPLLLLHGGFTSIQSSFAALLPGLARSRQVIAVEQQGHGRTADIDRPLTFEHMIADTVALLDELGVEQIDLFGYSMGGCLALGLAIRHPQRVGRLALLGTNFNNQGLYPHALDGLLHPDPAALAPALRQEYERIAPHPEAWPVLAQKVARSAAGFQGWQPAELRAVRAPTLVMVGDSDIVRPEHALELYRLLPNAHLAVLPLTHHGAPFQRPAWILSMLAEFFDAPLAREDNR